MGDIADHAISNKKRDYPAWGYLLGGGALGGLGVWFVLAEVFEDSRRPYLPWLMIGVSLWVIACGVREWTRNGSLTANSKARSRASDRLNLP